jgi:hypothetical protein
MLLVDGFTRSETSGVSLSALPNMKTGAIVPADMTASVCKRKAGVTAAKPSELKGWAVSLGSYGTPKLADMALRGRLLSSAGRSLKGDVGIIRLPGTAGYAAAVWALDQQTSLAACAAYRTEKAPCEVLPPDTLAQIAALTPVTAPKPAAATEQGSDSGKKKRKKKKNTR